ncbi:MAG: hypothetical protein ACRED2_03490 [Methylocella sp.]
MPMETGICTPAITPIGAPTAGHTAKVTFKRPGGRTLEELPKQEVKKSSVRDTRERNALNQANRYYRDRCAATLTCYTHGEIRANARSIKPSL